MGNLLKQDTKQLWTTTIAKINSDRIEFSHLGNYIEDFYQSFSKSKIYKQPILNFESFMYWFWHFNYKKSKNKEIIKQLNELLKEKSTAWFVNEGVYLFNNMFNHLFFDNGKLISSKKRFSIAQQLSNVLKGPSYCYVSEYPKSIILELTASCNLSCIMCGNAKQKRGFSKQKTMNKNYLEYMASTLVPKAEWVRLNGFGESTIIPNFLEYLDIIISTRDNSNLELSTNLTINNSRIWKELVKSGCVLLISCDGSTKELQERIRKGCSWEQLTKNLVLIKNYKDEFGFSEQNFFLFTAQPHNITDLPNMIDLAKNFAVHGVIVNMINSPSASSWMIRCYDEIVDIFDQTIQKAEQLKVDLKLPSKLGDKVYKSQYSFIVPRKTCKKATEEICVRYNGDLTVCNMFNPYCYGNSTYNRFGQVWNSCSARLFRSLSKVDIIPPFCKKCYYLQKKNK